MYGKIYGKFWAAINQAIKLAKVHEILIHGSKIGWLPCIKISAQLDVMEWEVTQKNDIYSCQMRLLGGTPYMYYVICSLLMETEIVFNWYVAKNDVSILFLNRNVVIQLLGWAPAQMWVRAWVEKLMEWNSRNL